MTGRVCTGVRDHRWDAGPIAHQRTSAMVEHPLHLFAPFGSGLKCGVTIAGGADDPSRRVLV